MYIIRRGHKYEGATSMGAARMCMSSGFISIEIKNIHSRPTRSIQSLCMPIAELIAIRLFLMTAAQKAPYGYGAF